MLKKIILDFAQNNLKFSNLQIIIGSYHGLTLGSESKTCNYVSCRLLYKQFVR